jgi:hypothetical protein
MIECLKRYSFFIPYFDLNYLAVENAKSVLVIPRRVETIPFCSKNSKLAVFFSVELPDNMLNFYFNVNLQLSDFKFIIKIFIISKMQKD